MRSTGMCQLQSNGPLNRYTLGIDSGVKGHWSADSDGRCVTLTRPGKMPFSGEVSLCASTPDGGDTTAVPSSPSNTYRDRVCKFFEINGFYHTIRRFPELGPDTGIYLTE